MTTRYRDFSPRLPPQFPAFGTVRIAGTGEALTHCVFFDPLEAPPPPPGWQWADSDRLLDEGQRVLDDYFSTGTLAAKVPLAPRGTDFQRQVWDALLEIPAGDTRTYTAIARRLGRPTAVRAVAAAIGRNPISILIPCHRVIGSDGSLTGYAWGLERKATLLKLEGALA